MLPLFEHFALFAALEWLKLLFVIVFFVIWIINNLLGNKGKVKPPQRPMIPPRDLDVLEEQPAPQQQLAGEIEEFLQRANRKRQEKVRRKQPAKVATKQSQQTPAKPTQRLVQSDADKQGFEVTTRATVAEHVRARLENRGFDSRAEHLTDDITKGDVDREAHRKQVFEHKVGTLTDTSTSQADDDKVARDASQVATNAASMAAATPIASMLANPESLKQAIILNEILSRPEHRWQRY